MRDTASGFIRDYIRPYMPRFTRQYNGGVKIKDYSLIDPVLGGESLNETSYKENLVEAVCETVSTEDDVVIVGGGFGVTSVHAYRESKGRVSYSGEITVFEPSNERYEKCRKTLELNDADVDLRREAVGVVKKKIGSLLDAGYTHPSDLPECNVLELDCEGAELEILRQMEIQPETIIVETHLKYDSSTEEVKQALQKAGYTVVQQLPDCEHTNDNVVLAKYTSGDSS